MTIPTPQQLIEAGAHVGRRKSKWNPKMAPFVFGVRNNIHIIDVHKTIEALQQAIDFLKDIKRSGGTVLFVGVKLQSRNIVRETAESLGMPYVVGRWIGGLFTNFKVVRGRLKFFNELEEKKISGEIDKYTKKERLSVERQLKKMEEELGGIKNLEKPPQAIVISDAEEEKTALAEARKMGIPTIAIVDTDADPTLVDWPIPANDSAVASLTLLYKAIKEELARVSVELKTPPSASEEKIGGKDQEKKKVILDSK